VADSSGSPQTSGSWATRGDPAAVAAALKEAGRALGGKVSAERNNLIDMTFGSRTGYHLLGTLASVRRRPVILRVSVDVASTDVAMVTVTALNDPGRYAVQVSSFSSRQFAKACSRLMNGLREAAPPMDRV
jgi:hypothetical protein